MLNVFKALFIFTGLIAIAAAGHNSCRQCKGAQTITLNTRVGNAQALAFFKASIGNCATGGDLEVTSALGSDCEVPCATNREMPHTTYCVLWAPRVCRIWTINVKVWRYCGNGGLVNLKKANHCSGGLCASSDNLSLTCWKSVECRGDCNCGSCGC